jgi:hypothetical protein
MWNPIEVLPADVFGVEANDEVEVIQEAHGGGLQRAFQASAIEVMTPVIACSTSSSSGPMRERAQIIAFEKRLMAAVLSASWVWPR